MADRISRRHFLKTSVVSGAAMASISGARAFGGGDSIRPNIILIMADDLGYECLSCYGCAEYDTPNLDRLAATGLQFQNCHSQPLCTPSRVKIMTGQYNCRNYERFGALNPEETTFGHVMQNAGYATCIVGKWQLAARSGGRGTYPQKAGFDDYCLWQIDDRKSRYADPLIQMKGEDHAHFHKGEYGPDIFCDYMNDFMESHRHRPFFVYFPMCLVHSPFVPTPDSPEWKGNRNKRAKKFFKDMVEYMDTLVGRIVRKLDEVGLRDETLLMFTGDNGTHRSIETEMQDGSVIKGGKRLTIDTGTHVPFVANWPGVTPQGRLLEDLIDFSDFLPTIAEAGGARLPADEQFDGVSFLQQLKGKEGSPRDHIYCYYKLKGQGGDYKEWARDERWKLYSTGELYDVQADLLEKHPIPKAQGGKAAARARKKLRAALNSAR